MDEESYMSCNICMKHFDDRIRPRMLPCGHNFCGSCITRTIKEEKLVCPQCQKEHFASDCHYFAINFALEGLIRQIRRTTIETHAAPSPLIACTSNQTGGSVIASLNKEKTSLLSGIKQNRELRSDLKKYESYLCGIKNVNEELVSTLRLLLMRNKEVIEQMDTEIKRSQEMVKEGEVHEKQIGCCTSVSIDSNNIISASDEIEKCATSLDEWYKKTQNQFPSASLIKYSEKLSLETALALKEFTTRESMDEFGKTCKLDIAESSLPIMDKIRQITGNLEISVRHLKDNTPMIRESLREGLLYAVQNYEDEIRWAQVTKSNDTLYLHHLRDKKPSFCANTIEYGDLVEALVKEPVTTFMDFSRSGEKLGRIHITLSPDAPRARHFRALCTGEYGPSYANTNLLRMGMKGDDIWEGIVGGDYEYNNGNGGAPIYDLFHSSNEIYKREDKLGVVMSLSATLDGPNIAQFLIRTGRGTRELHKRIFGQVRDGYDVLEKIMKLDDIKEVLIEDCGVILEIQN